MASTTATLRTVLMLLWSVLLTSLTGILGVAPLKVVRKQLGAAPFWLLGVGLSLLFWSTKLPALGIAMIILTVLVASQAQAEEMGFGLFKSAFLGITSAALTMGGLAYVWISKMGPEWATLFKERIGAQLSALGQSSELLLVSKLTADDVFHQIPSMLVGALVIAASIGLILEKPLMKWVGLTVPRRQKLVNFRLHEAFIWPVIAGILFAFVDMGYPTLKIVAMNVLNVAVICYFFQGLAVLCKYFVVFKVGTFWRALFVLLFTTQLFLVLSAIGFVDFWADFRVYFNKRAAEMKKKGSVR